MKLETYFFLHTTNPLIALKAICDHPSSVFFLSCSINCRSLSVIIAPSPLSSVVVCTSSLFISAVCSSPYRCCPVSSLSSLIYPIWFMETSPVVFIVFAIVFCASVLYGCSYLRSSSVAGARMQMLHCPCLFLYAKNFLVVGFMSTVHVSICLLLCMSCGVMTV